MKKYLIFVLILAWTLLFCSTIFYWAKQKIEVENSKYTKLNTAQTYLIIDSLGNYHLSQLENTVVPVVFYPLQLQFGDISLSVLTDTIDQQIVYSPQNLPLFKNACIAQLGVSNPKDSAANWLSSKNKLEQFLKVELASLSKINGWQNFLDEKKIGIALIKHLQNGFGILISGKEIISISTLNLIEYKADNYILVQDKTNKGKDFISNKDWLLLLGLISFFSIGMWLLLKHGIESRNIMQEIEVENKDDFDKPNVKKTPEFCEDLQFLKQYTDGFHDKYKSFFEDIQKIPIEPTLIERIKIKQDLVEMGLHAYSLVRAYRMNNMNSLAKEPNLLLIIEKKTVSELPKNLYREFIEDPERMEKRFLILKKIIEEMGITTIENALISDVYLNVKPIYNL